MIINPKMLELSLYEGIPHLYTRVTQPARRGAGGSSGRWGRAGPVPADDENGVRHIDAFNQFVEKRQRAGKVPAGTETDDLSKLRTSSSSSTNWRT